jgi:alkyl hydroperoxide reductase subunit AhpF
VALIGASDSRALRERFAALDRPVRLLVFTTPDDCRYCAQTMALAGELAALDHRLTVETVDLAAQPERGTSYGVDKAPAIVVLVAAGAGDDGASGGNAGEDGAGSARRAGSADGALHGQGLRDTGIRFFGIPAGHEFSSLVDAVVAASRAEPKLAPPTAAWLSALDRPLHLQVFVTPTCPYCPRAVTLAHRLALASPHIRADMVEATEFPELAERYEVMGVPRTVINDAIAVEGAVPEDYLLSALQEAVAGVS